MTASFFQTIPEWQNVFIVTFGIICFAVIFYVLFGSGKIPMCLFMLISFEKKGYMKKRLKFGPSSMHDQPCIVFHKTQATHV